jgi:nicotinate-nucleotide adenylyltransferase
VGLFGGAFDPPHSAHQALLTAARGQLGLGQVRVLPTGQPWHRARQPSAAAHRLAMAQLAFADLPGVVVDARELQRPGPTYTVDTVRELAAEHPGTEWWLLLGQDQWQALPTWHEWPALAALVQVAVAVRGASQLHPTEHAVPGAALPLRATPLALTPMDVSATRIRQMVGEGAVQTSGLAGLVSPAVARYIDQHHLYQ